MKFSFDKFNRHEIPTMVLAYPNFREIAVLCSIKAPKIGLFFNATSPFSFEIDDTKLTNHFFNDVVKNNLIHVYGIGWWVIESVEDTNEGGATRKKVACKSYEHTLTTRPANIDAGTYKFYDVVSPEDTLLGKIIRNTRTWSVGYVSVELTNKYRTFEMPNSSMVDFLRSDVSEAYECIFDFDFENFKINAYTHSDLINDTDIVLTFDNLLKSVVVETTADKIISALSIYGSGDFSINNVNPLGTSTIYDFTYYKDKMSDGLWSAIEAWQAQIEAQTVPYADLLTTQKNLNVSLLALQANQSKAEIIRAAGRQVQDVHESYTLQSYSNSSLTNIKTWINGLPYASLMEMITSAVAYPAINFDSPPSAISGYVSQIAVADKGIAQALANIHACDVLLVMTTNEAASINASIDTVRSQLLAINQQLAFANWFTDAQLDELDTYIVADTYTNEYYVMLPSMSYVDIQELSMELLEVGKSVLKRVSQPTYTFKLDSVAYPFLKDYEYFTQQTSLGCVVHAEVNEGEWVQPLLLGVELNFDSPDDFLLIFGNRFRLQTDEYIYEDLYNDINKVSGSVSGNFSQLMGPVRDGTNDEVRELLNGVWDASKNAIIAGSHQAMTIDDRGLIGKKADLDSNGNPTGFFDPEQLRIINNLLCFTDDNWQNVKTALGKLDLGNGNYAYGLSAEVIIGQLIAGSQLILTNESGTFRFDGAGATLTNATFSVISTNGLSRIYLNATDGFKIQTRPNTSAAWTDTLYIDTAGNLIMNGRITASSGNIGGWIIVSGGLSYNSNQLYLGVTPITAAINGVNRSVVFRAGSNFGVGADGTLYARSAVFSNLTNDGGNFTNITASGNISANTIVAGASISSPVINGGTINGSQFIGAFGSFTNLNAAGGNVDLYSNFIRISGIYIGQVAGYSDVSVVPPAHQSGNLGTGSSAWGQCVAYRLYAQDGDVHQYSMRKLKENITPFSADIIDELTPVRYNMRNDIEKTPQIGFIADDVREICPELVREFQDDGMDEPILTLGYGRMTAILVDEAQRSKRRVQNLEQKIEEQQKEIDELKACVNELRKLVMHIE